MKKIYAKGAFQIVPAGKGFIFVAQQSEKEGQFVVSYKMHTFEGSSTSLITRNVYLMAKFGHHFDFYEKELGDYINCKTVLLDDFRLLVVYPTGEAYIYDNGCKMNWSGEIRHQGYGPADLLVIGDSFWCSFPETNSLIRYNIRTMRSEMRIGGPDSEHLIEPYGLFAADDGSLIITSSKTGGIQKLDLKKYTLSEYLSLTEPVYQYAKIEFNEIILSESGIYKL